MVLWVQMAWKDCHRGWGVHSVQKVKEELQKQQSDHPLTVNRGQPSLPFCVDVSVSVCHSACLAAEEHPQIERKRLKLCPRQQASGAVDDLEAGAPVHINFTQ